MCMRQGVLSSSTLRRSSTNRKMKLNPTTRPNFTRDQWSSSQKACKHGLPPGTSRPTWALLASDARALASSTGPGLFKINPNPTFDLCQMAKDYVGLRVNISDNLWLSWKALFLAPIPFSSVYFSLRLRQSRLNCKLSLESWFSFLFKVFMKAFLFRENSLLFYLRKLHTLQFSISSTFQQWFLETWKWLNTSRKFLCAP